MVLEHHGAIRARIVDLLVLQQHARRCVTGVRPATMLSRVDLPQPEWPMMETYSPLLDADGDVGQHLGLLRAADEGFVDVVDLQR